MKNDNKNALRTAQVFRRQLLDEVIRLIQAEEQQKPRLSTSWADVGAVEKQCSFLQEILEELKNPMQL